MITKLSYLEALRGCAALIVVMTHFAAAFTPFAVFGPPYEPHYAFEHLLTSTPLSLTVAGHFAVCLFFVLSGYVLSLPYVGGESERKNDSLVAAIIKRPIRLGGLVMTTMFLSVVLSESGMYHNQTASSISGSQPWFSNFFSEALYHSPKELVCAALLPFSEGYIYNPPLWTIEKELYGSFLTYGFLILFRQSKLRFLAYLAAITLFRDSLYHGFLVGILVADFQKSNPAIWLSLMRTHLWAIVLVLGIFFASVPNYSESSKSTSWVYSWLPEIQFVGGGYAMLGATFFFLGVLLSQKIQRVLAGTALTFLGKVSFAVYAVHFLVLASVTSWLFVCLRPYIDYGPALLIAAACYFVVTLLVGILLTSCIDEPITRLANRVASQCLSSLNRRRLRKTMHVSSEQGT